MMLSVLSLLLMFLSFCWKSGEAACAEEGSLDVLFWRNLRMGDVKQHNTHIEREREAQRV